MIIMIKRISILIMLGWMMFPLSRVYAEGESGNIVQQLNEIKKEKQKFVDEYNRQKKGLHKSLQDRLKQYDDPRRDQEARAQLIRETSKKEAELRQAFQSTMKGILDKEQELISKNINSSSAQKSGWLIQNQQQIDETQRMQDLQKRIAEQDREREKENPKVTSTQKSLGNQIQNVINPKDQNKVDTKSRYGRKIRKTKTASDMIRESMQRIVDRTNPEYK